MLIGPSLAGIAITGNSRIPGLDAEAYIRESIIDPDAYIVEGYPSGQMLPDLEDKLTPDQIDDLVSFLLTMNNIER